MWKRAVIVKEINVFMCQFKAAQPKSTRQYTIKTSKQHHVVDICQHWMTTLQWENFLDAKSPFYVCGGGLSVGREG